MTAAEQMPETAHVVDYDATPTGAPECVDDCPGCVDDALSPTLRRLRDAILAEPAMTPAEALLDAQELLADHARELAALVQQRIDQDRADNPSGAYPKHRRGGMAAARSLLDQYADDLDAAGGGA